MKYYMPKDVRPRISIKVYQLVREAAASSCVSENHWLIEAIKEKAAREGFEIIDAQVVKSKSNSDSKSSLTLKEEIVEPKGGTEIEVRSDEQRDRPVDTAIL